MAACRLSFFGEKLKADVTASYEDRQQDGKT